MEFIEGLLHRFVTNPASDDLSAAGLIDDGAGGGFCCDAAAVSIRRGQKPAPAAQTFAT